MKDCCIRGGMVDGPNFNDHLEQIPSPRSPSPKTSSPGVLKLPLLGPVSQTQAWGRKSIGEGPEVSARCCGRGQTNEASKHLTLISASCRSSQ